MKSCATALVLAVALTALPAAHAQQKEPDKEAMKADGKGMMGGG